jgi:hypothetical protein
MTSYQIIVATISFFIIVSILYFKCGFKEIKNCYGMWFTKKYWTDYNIVEAVSWFCKAIIIIPGLIFNIHIWYFYFLTLLTSATLIWASNKKMLPTLVWFNSMWIWLSCMVLARHLIDT